jgi:hypothetical protein
MADQENTDSEVMPVHSWMIHLFHQRCNHVTRCADKVPELLDIKDLLRIVGLAG